MTNHVRNIVRDTVKEMLSSSSSDDNIQRMLQKHSNKVHFVPMEYRIIGGILQGLNIKFGNFIEHLMRNIVEMDTNVHNMPDSGQKIELCFTPETDTLIDSYITSRQLPDSSDNCKLAFDALLKHILEIEQNSSSENRQVIIKDVDSLFRTSTGLTVYAELKYNDDHDTGKFADINRKFIKTWAGLAVRLNITDANDLLPIIYYLNPTKRYGPIHTPSANIMRGSQFFERFLQTKYTDVSKYLTEISNDREIIDTFDNMLVNIRRLSNA